MPFAGRRPTREFSLLSIQIRVTTLFGFVEISGFRDFGISMEGVSRATRIGKFANSRLETKYRILNFPDLSLSPSLRLSLFLSGSTRCTKIASPTSASGGSRVR